MTIGLHSVAVLFHVKIVCDTSMPEDHSVNHDTLASKISARSQWIAVIMDKMGGL